MKTRPSIVAPSLRKLVLGAAIIMLAGAGCASTHKSQNGAQQGSTAATSNSAGAQAKDTQADSSNTKDTQADNSQTDNSEAPPAEPAPTLGKSKPCPYKFTLSGKTTEFWKSVTPSAWSKMLPANWTDNGYHFYQRAKQRGPEDGINSPSDLESEIMKKVADKSAGSQPQRRQIVLPIKNSKGANLRVIYDYAGGATSKCQLVTLSY